MKNLTRYQPAELLEKYRAIRASITDKEFFRSPKHKKTQEMWCAAHFSRAYSKYISPCTVLIDERDLQTDTDFDLDIDGLVHPFQVTEIMEPGRRRGEEYRDGTPIGVRYDDIEAGTVYGPTWIRHAIERKLEKRYAAASDLNLLVYVDFAGRNLEYDDLRNTCADVACHFASVWLLNGDTMCCVHHNPRLAKLDGWMTIPESLACVEP